MYIGCAVREHHSPRLIPAGKLVSAHRAGVPTPGWWVTPGRWVAALTGATIAGAATHHPEVI